MTTTDHRDWADALMARDAERHLDHVADALREAAAVLADMTRQERRDLYGEGDQPVLDDEGGTLCCGTTDLDWVVGGAGPEPRCAGCGAEVEVA